MQQHWMPHSNLRCQKMSSKEENQAKVSHLAKIVNTKFGESERMIPYSTTWCKSNQNKEKQQEIIKDHLGSMEK
jgi:hypothetical protein